MATKSFTANIKFNQRSANSLIKALNKNRKPKQVKTDIEVIKDLSIFDKMIDRKVK